MRLNRKEQLLLFDEPLSIAEEAAYHTTVESIQENHAYSFLRRMPSYPNKSTVTALQLSRTPSLISLVSAQSPRCSTPSSFRCGKYAPSVSSVPSLARSNTSNSRTTIYSSNSQSVSVRKHSPPPTNEPGSSSSLTQSGYMNIRNEDLSAFRILYGIEQQQQPHYSSRPPRPSTRPTPRKSIIPDESIIEPGQILNQLVVGPTTIRPISLPLDGRFSPVHRGKAPSGAPRDTKTFARSLAGRSTLLAGKTVPSRMSIYEKLANLEAGFRSTEPDVFDFELPGFDPCMNRVLVGGYK